MASPLPPVERGHPHPHLSPGHRCRAVAGSGENWETCPSHSLPRPQPLPEGRSKVLEVATAAPCPAAPNPTTTTANGLGVSETCCAASRRSRPGLLPRIPLLAATSAHGPREDWHWHRRTRRKKTNATWTSLPAWRAGLWEVHCAACV